MKETFASNEELKAIPGNPNPVTEMNAFMDDRVILYGHPGLCRTPEELLSSDGFHLVLRHFLKKMSAQDSPILNCIHPFKNGAEYDIQKLSEFFKDLLTKDVHETAYANTDLVHLKDVVEEL